MRSTCRACGARTSCETQKGACHTLQTPLSISGKDGEANASYLTIDSYTVRLSAVYDDSKISASLSTLLMTQKPCHAGMLLSR